VARCRDRAARGVFSPRAGVTRTGRVLNLPAVRIFPAFRGQPLPRIGRQLGAEYFPRVGDPMGIESYFWPVSIPPFGVSRTEPNGLTRCVFISSEQWSSMRVSSLTAKV
jgi:hypothetical protein